jgi:serpin B
MKIGTASLLAAAPLPACAGGSAPSPTPEPQEMRSDRVRDANPQVPAADAAALAQGNLQFAVDMHARLRAGNTGNFIFSPASISTALAMLYAGAAGNTAAQMASTLHFTLPPERLHPAFNALDLALTTPPAGADGGAFRLEIGNGTWAQDGFPVLGSYLDTLALNYGAGLYTDDFAADAEGARQRINGWVSDHTEHQIPTLFGQGTISSATLLVLANAVFFHGDWKAPFDSMSPGGTFHAAGGDVTLPTMQGHHNGALSSGPGWQAATLDYVGDTTSMVVIVPDAGTFDAFEQGLTADALAGMLAPGADRPRRRGAAPVQVRDRHPAEPDAAATGDDRPVRLQRRRPVGHRRPPRPGAARRVGQRLGRRRRRRDDRRHVHPQRCACPAEAGHHGQP